VTIDIIAHSNFQLLLKSEFSVIAFPVEVTFRLNGKAFQVTGAVPRAFFQVGNNVADPL